ncbi:hypothetical protein BH20CHL6_BH20CHL6_04600 [soil metagenome]
MYRSHRALPIALATALLATAAIAAPVGAGGNSLAFNVGVGQGCLSGTGPPETEHVVSLRTPDGKLRGRFRVDSDREGFWIGCFGTFFGGPVVILGGEQLKVIAGGEQHTLRVPKLFPQIDRERDVVAGKAPAGDDVLIFVRHRRGFGNGRTLTRSVSADATGRYSTDFSDEVDLIAFDAVDIAYFNGRDSVSAFAQVPGINLTINDNNVFGVANPGPNVSFTLRAPDGTIKDRTRTGPVLPNFLLAQFTDPDGDPVYVRMGDRVTASLAGDADVRVPGMALNGSASSDIVAGKCMPNAPFLVLITRFDFDGEEGEIVFEEVRGRTGSDGRFSRNVSSVLDLKRGDDLTLTCRYATGDVIGRSTDVGR